MTNNEEDRKRPNVGAVVLTNARRTLSTWHVESRQRMGTMQPGESSLSLWNDFDALAQSDDRQQRHRLKAERARGREIGPSWLKSLASFEKRLRWHCHFMQKLEDQPSLESQNMSRIYDGLRQVPPSDELFDAYCRGETGYPMVDACIRALRQTGWINFRMRAMLVSFASYHLWLPWQDTARFWPGNLWTSNPVFTTPRCRCRVVRPESTHSESIALKNRSSTMTPPVSSFVGGSRTTTLFLTPIYPNPKSTFLTARTPSTT